jgi:hypothetical protein
LISANKRWCAACCETEWKKLLEQVRASKMLQGTTPEVQKVLAACAEGSLDLTGGVEDASA